VALRARANRCPAVPLANALKGFDLGAAGWKDMIPAVFGEHRDLPGHLIREGEREAEEDV